MQWLLVLGIAAAAACSFTPPGAAPADAREDAPTDAPLPAPEVRFVSVTASAATLRPGRYGIEVTAVLRNELAVEITGVRASLTFREGAADRASVFRWRDADARDGVMAPQPASIPPGEEATFRFRVDALARAVPLAPGASILLDGQAVFQHGGQARSATGLEAPTPLPFEALPPPIVVTKVDDEDNGDAALSFREALKRANDLPGFDRIVFDPQVFPPNTQTVTTLDEDLGPLPDVMDDLVIDGSDVDFVLAADSSWEDSAGRYGLRLQSGTLVVDGLGFRDMGFNYPAEDVSGDNCGSNQQHEGGAIRVGGGTLILEDNLFADTGVGERNCYAASVRIHAGSGHRILNNRWTDPSMDSLFIAAAVREVSDNVMDAGTNPGKADECIFIESQGDADLWIVGNLCVDQEYSAVVAGSTGSGTLYVVNNTFARNREIGAVRRTGGSRRVVLHNNAYHGNQPTAILADNNGTDFTISHEAESGSGAFCNGCGSATMTMNTLDADLGFTNPAGTTRADFTPRAGSTLVGSGLDLIDRNGSAPGRFNGAAPDRGAVELP